MRSTPFRLAHLGLRNTHVQTRFSPADIDRLVSSPDATVEVEPGQLVLSVCKEHGIAFPNRLSALRGLKLPPNPYKLGVSVSQQHCFSQLSMKYFDKIEHPFAKSLLDIYIEKSKEPLWISSVTHGAGPFASKKAAKKVTHALRDALEAAGYDRFGRRAPADGKPSATADLYGTIRVTSTEPQAICNAKFADLVELARKIVSCAETGLGRDKDGRHHHPESRQNNKYSPRRPDQKHNEQQKPFRSIRKL
ncbi:hypothetical protein F5Y14DRAFT_160181 [Nemania sp. NC0429]|nr:hypothetical protein F5Y14DRAFT_160181 [Nemania sp. NC0429]